MHCGTVCGEEIREGTIPLAQLSARFQSFPLLPTSKLGTCGADALVGGFVYIPGPYGSLQQALLWSWESLLLPQPPQVFTARGFEVFFSLTGTLGCVVYLAPWLFLPVYPHANVGPTAAILPAQSSSHHLALHPLCPGCLSLLLLPVWMNVSTLTPWFSDFYTVWFSGRSGCFCFKFVVVLLLVVWGSKMYLPTPPSCLKAFLICSCVFGGKVKTVRKKWE